MGGHFLLQGGLPNPGIELGSPTLKADSLSSESRSLLPQPAVYTPNVYSLLFDES